MKINPTTGLLTPCTQTPSPNCDQRPDNQNIELIVIHSISLPPGQYGGDAIERFFSNRLPADEHPYYREIHQLKVSSHILIKRDGSLVQFVPFHQRAWHAGVSSYCGRERCNDFSIGIELEGTDTDCFTEAQYTQLAELITRLQSAYPSIKKEAITGHSNIAPGRKTDPGAGFDWNKLKQLLG
ncbi:MAG TPA: 1,6-anhydro-N-acetylmuramyl-L-alanine amidase AmpD [Thiotrichales bacterium]|nr:1,6-anhydro-N-acetylmuramyl-L-alanine amidase AmpD [Thiotrichales bacterium]